MGVGAVGNAVIKIQPRLPGERTAGVGGTPNIIRDLGLMIKIRRVVKNVNLRQIEVDLRRAVVLPVGEDIGQRQRLIELVIRLELPPSYGVVQCRGGIRTHFYVGGTW